jgi:hypothetical protein
MPAALALNTRADTERARIIHTWWVCASHGTCASVLARAASAFRSESRGALPCTSFHHDGDDKGGAEEDGNKRGDGHNIRTCMRNSLALPRLLCFF